MRESSRRRDGNSRRIKRRSIVGLLIGTASLVVLPVAVVWACAPSTAQIAFDRAEYRAGETVKVIGSGFAPLTPVDLSLQPASGARQAVAPGTATNDRGYFEASFALPSNAAPGTYALQAMTTPSGQGHGGQVQPTTATDTFTVTAPRPAPLPPAAALVVPQSLAPAPAAPATKPVTSRRVALSRAIRKCKKKYRARRSTTASKKRKLAKRRAACVRKAKKRYRR